MKNLQTKVNVTYGIKVFLIKIFVRKNVTILHEWEKLLYNDILTWVGKKKS